MQSGSGLKEGASNHIPNCLESLQPFEILPALDFRIAIESAGLPRFPSAGIFGKSRQMALSAGSALPKMCSSGGNGVKHDCSKHVSC
jgi:hypothetical protein